MGVTGLQLQVYRNELNEDAFPFLVIEKRTIVGEEVLFFSTPTSQYTARLITSPDSIVVQHDVAEVETATFPRKARANAITFIESLLYVFQ